jgi:hypothetical protein
MRKINYGKEDEHSEGAANCTPDHNPSSPDRFDGIMVNGKTQQPTARI